MGSSFLQFMFVNEFRKNKKITIKIKLSLMERRKLKTENKLFNSFNISSA